MSEQNNTWDTVKEDWDAGKVVVEISHQQDIWEAHRETSDLDGEQAAWVDIYIDIVAIVDGETKKDRITCWKVAGYSSEYLNGCSGALDGICWRCDVSDGAMNGASNDNGDGDIGTALAQIYGIEIKDIPDDLADEFCDALEEKLREHWVDSPDTDISELLMHAEPVLDQDDEEVDGLYICEEWGGVWYLWDCGEDGKDTEFLRIEADDDRYQMISNNVPEKYHEYLDLA